MKSLQTNIALCSTLACSLLALCPGIAQAQRITPSASQGGVSWQVTSPNDGVSLRVSQPDGTVFERTFPSGQLPAFTSPAGVLPDGSYTYELRVSPVARAEAKNADGDGKAAPFGSVQSGSFRVVGGVVNLPDASRTEPQNPSAPEDIFTTVEVESDNPVITFDDTSVAPFPNNDWRLRANDTTSGGPTRFSIEDITGNTIPFTIRAGAPDNSLYVEAITGDVGMGTAVPVSDLHIVRTSGPTIKLEQTAGSGPRTWDIVGTNDVGFFIRDATQGTVPFTIESISGDVGIGTDDPAGRLHVRGAGAQLSIFQSSDNNAVQFRLQTNSTNRRFVALNASGTQQSQLVFGDNGAFDFLGATVADVRMSLIANGNVGIGTTAPDQKLSVNGNASKPGGGSWLAFSDERLKDIKGEFKGGLDEIMKLQPIRYEYKADNAIGLQSEGEHIGFGADAVSKVIPEAVTRSENGYLMIDNDPILWTMLNAIKEQNAQITDLKDQVKRLQTEVVLQAAAKKPANKKVAKSSR